jgi:hypothetical protein
MARRPLWLGSLNLQDLEDVAAKSLSLKELLVKYFEINDLAAKNCRQSSVVGRSRRARPGRGKELREFSFWVAQRFQRCDPPALNARRLQPLR